MHLAVVVGGLAHGHRSGLIEPINGYGGAGGVDVLHALVIGFLRLAAQAVIQRLQAGDGCLAHRQQRVAGLLLIVLLADGLELDVHGTAIGDIGRHHILQQVVVRIVRPLIAQGLLSGEIPGLAAVQRAHQPILLIGVVGHIAADEHMIPRLRLQHGALGRLLFAAQVGDDDLAVQIRPHAPGDAGPALVGRAAGAGPGWQPRALHRDIHRDLRHGLQLIGVDLGHLVQPLDLVGGQQLPLVAVQGGVGGLDILHQPLVVVGVQVVQVAGQIVQVLPQAGDDGRVVDGRRAQLLQPGKVRIKAAHQQRQILGRVQMRRQCVVLRLERGVALRRKVIVVEAVEIRLGLGGLFGAVLLQQRGGIVCLRHIDHRVVAAVEGVILAQRHLVIHAGKGQLVRRHIEHGHRVPPRLGEHILQVPVLTGDGSGLVDGLPQRLRLGGRADEQGDARGAPALTQAVDIRTGHGGGNAHLVAHLRSGGGGHVDLGNAALILAGIRRKAGKYLGGVVATGGLMPAHRRRHAHQAHLIALMQLGGVQPPLQHTQRGKAVALAVDKHGKVGIRVAVVIGAVGQLVELPSVPADAGGLDRAGQRGAAAGQGQGAVYIQLRAAFPDRGVQGGKVVDVRKGHRHIHAAGQLPPGGFQRVDMRFKMGPLTGLIVPVISVEAPQHEIILIGAGGARCISHIRLQGGVGRGIGLPALRRVVALLQLGGVILGQQGPRLGLMRLIIGHKLRVGLRKHQTLRRLSQPVDLRLRGWLVAVRGDAVFVIQRFQQRFARRYIPPVCRQRGRGGVLRCDILQKSSLANIVFSVRDILAIPYPVACDRLIQCRGVDPVGGDQLGDGGLQGGGRGVQLRLGIRVGQGALRTGQRLLVLLPEAAVPADILIVEDGVRRLAVIAVAGGIILPVLRLGRGVDGSLQGGSVQRGRLAELQQQHAAGITLAVAGAIIILQYRRIRMHLQQAERHGGVKLHAGGAEKSIESTCLHRGQIVGLHGQGRCLTFYKCACFVPKCRRGFTATAPFQKILL